MVRFEPHPVARVLLSGVRIVLTTRACLWV